MLPQKEMLPHYTYDDYLLWEGKWELISGIPYAMSPAPTPKHQRIASDLTAEFVQSLKHCQHCKVYQPIDYKVEEDTVLQPDILIACREIDKKFLDFAPALVVEILSPSTAVKDRHTKFLIYESQGIRHFIIISPSKEVVEIYELDDGEYTLVNKGKSIDHQFVVDNCKMNIDFSKLW